MHPIFIEEQIKGRGVSDPRVLKAMEKVPRERFVGTELREDAYADHPLPIGHGQTISQPFIVASMTELLKLSPDSKVLEVGTGCGYQTAVLAEIAKEVYSVEIIPELAKKARETLAELGYENVAITAGDGAMGYRKQAPYDGIIVTAAAPQVPPALVQQLKPGGRLVIPIGGQNQVQELFVIEKQQDGSTVEKPQYPVRFVPLTG